MQLRHLPTKSALAAGLMAAMTFGGQARADEDALAQMPKGPGLSAQFPGDRGIERAPGVIFATGFEDGINDPMRPRRKGVSIIKDPDVARAGNAAAQIVATKDKDTGGDLIVQWDEGAEQVFVRVYVKFHENTAMPHHFINVSGHTPTYEHRFGGGAGKRPPGGENGAFRATLEPPKNDNQRWKFYTYWHEMRSWQTPEGDPDGRPNPYYGNNFAYPVKTPPVKRDEWVCVEYMLKLNDVGQSNGALAFWIDGEPMGFWRPGAPTGRWLRENFFTFGQYFDNYNNPQPFEGFNWRTVDELKINRVMLQWYLSERSYRDTEIDEHIVYFDNLVIADKYIGPIAE